MLFKFIDFKYFILSLSVGLLYIYLTNEYKKSNRFISKST